jgi:hypothetical protein
MPPSTAKAKSPRRGEGDPIDQYAAIVWRVTDPKPTKLWFPHPVDALTTAVEYLKAGWQVRLSDGTVRYFAELPRPDPAFVDAARANGQAAALTGPPDLGGQ